MLLTIIMHKILLFGCFFMAMYFLVGEPPEETADTNK